MVCESIVNMGRACVGCREFGRAKGYLLKAMRLLPPGPNQRIGKDRIFELSTTILLAEGKILHLNLPSSYPQILFVALNGPSGERRAKLDTLGKITTKYIADNKNNIPNDMLYYVMGMHAGSLEPKEALSFMKETRQQYLKNFGEDECYWKLLANFADTLTILGMKHQASKLFRKIKQQKDQFNCESTVHSNNPAVHYNFNFSLCLPRSFWILFSLISVLLDTFTFQCSWSKGCTDTMLVLCQGNNAQGFIP